MHSIWRMLWQFLLQTSISYAQCPQIIDCNQLPIALAPQPSLVLLSATGYISVRVHEPRQLLVLVKPYLSLHIMLLREKKKKKHNKAKAKATLPFFCFKNLSGSGVWKLLHYRHKRRPMDPIGSRTEQKNGKEKCQCVRALTPEPRRRQFSHFCV